MHAHSHSVGSHAHRHEHTHADLALDSGRMIVILGLSVFVTLLLVLIEFSASYFGHSISLASDAIHNLTDVPALFISWLAARWSLRPPTHEHTYGYHRAGILAAFTNALLLAIFAVFIMYEAFERLRSPMPVHVGVMLWVALAALVVNGGITLALVSGSRDLNLRSIFVHSAGDALSNVAIMLGALVIHWTGARWVDPCLGIAIGALVMWSGIGILRESSHILLEGHPREIQLEDVANAMLKVEGVQEVHDIHIWTLGTDLRALSCHVRIPDMHMDESQRVLEELQDRLRHDFQITHSTIQFERAGLPLHSGYYMPEPAHAPRK